MSHKPIFIHALEILRSLQRHHLSHADNSPKVSKYMAFGHGVPLSVAHCCWQADGLEDTVLLPTDLHDRGWIVEATLDPWPYNKPLRLVLPDGRTLAYEPNVDSSEAECILPNESIRFETCTIEKERFVVAYEPGKRTVFRITAKGLVAPSARL